MTAQPLTARELDSITCSAEKCGNTACDGAVAFHGFCHPSAPSWVWYDGRIKALTVKCSECGKVVCQVAVQGG